jgi:hypothetical protein
MSMAANGPDLRRVVITGMGIVSSTGRLISGYRSLSQRYRLGTPMPPRGERQ